MPRRSDKYPPGTVLEYRGKDRTRYLVGHTDADGVHLTCDGEPSGPVQVDRVEEYFTVLSRPEPEPEPTPPPEPEPIPDCYIVMVRDVGRIFTYSFEERDPALDVMAEFAKGGKQTSLRRTIPDTGFGSNMR